MFPKPTLFEIYFNLIKKLELDLTYLVNAKIKMHPFIMRFTNNCDVVFLVNFNGHL